MASGKGSTFLLAIVSDMSQLFLCLILFTSLSVSGDMLPLKRLAGTRK